MRNILLLFSILTLFSGCYSFQGIRIPNDVKTYFVENFDNRSNNVVPGLAIDFTAVLTDKIRNESRLIFTETSPDVEFSGYISDYRVTVSAPQPGEEVAFNRLTIYVKVAYTDHKNEDNNWDKTFNFFSEFPADQNLLDIQDDLHATILEQLVSDIFSDAFTNW